MKKLLLTLTGIASAVCALAQQSPFMKYGKVTVEDLQKKVYSIDSNATAVVLSDIGEASVEGNSKGWFSMVYKRHKLIHILNKASYDEGKVILPLYKDGSEEIKASDIKASTYNLENGKIVESKLLKSDIFTEKVDDKHSRLKLSLPNLKEGSIIEYEYVITSDDFQYLLPWEFQEDIPELWSEYKLSVPSFFTYSFFGHGYQPYTINTKTDHVSNFVIRETRTVGANESLSFASGVTDYRWVIKDVPALKEESFVTSIKNHTSRLEVRLIAQGDPLYPRDYRTTWQGLTKQLLESEYFGQSLKKTNGWLSDELKPLFASAKSDAEKIYKIYTYVRDNYSCTDHSALFTDQSLKNVFKTKKGSVAELNLLLVAMLNYAGFIADPVMLSTRENGLIMESYPTLSGFNYVIARVAVNDQFVLLDASHPRLGFGKLLPSCYNATAKIVNEDAQTIFLAPDSLKEKKFTSIFIINGEKGSMEGTFNKLEGYYESYQTREALKKEGKDEYFKSLKKDYDMDVKLTDMNIDSLEDYNVPLKVHYNMTLNPDNASVLYVNPMFSEAHIKNPFTSTQRLYPVEMPYTSDNTYVLTMEVPEGYVVDEIPKQVRVKLDEQESAYFEYLITVSDNRISLRSRLKFNRTFFSSDEYDMLRSFYNLVVAKQKEQIIFKKKK